jgi:hypothetical protein
MREGDEMGALEEYRRECEVLHLHKLPPAWVTISLADAAIAELLVEVERLKWMLNLSVTRRVAAINGPDDTWWQREREQEEREDLARLWEEHKAE